MNLPVTDHTALYLEHKSEVRALKRALLNELKAWSNKVEIVKRSSATETDSDDATDRIRLTAKEYNELYHAALDYIQDIPTLFRHLKMARYDVTVARRNIHETLRWRRSMCTHRHGYWMHRGLLHSGACRVVGRDPQQRQILWLGLNALSKAKATREEIRMFTVGMLEALRIDTKIRFEETGRMVQCVCVLDLAGVGLSSMDTELAPFVLDLLLNRFPSCFAAVYVYNYSWMYSGVWSLIKRLIPEESRGRVAFPNKAELQERLGMTTLPQDTSNYDPDKCAFLTEYRTRAAACGYDDEEEEEEEEKDDNTSGSHEDAENRATGDEDEQDDTEDVFYDAPLWHQESMQKYLDDRIAELERRLADAQALLRHTEQQLALVRVTPKPITVYREFYRELPKVLYRMGPRQLGSAFAWWRLSLSDIRRRIGQWLASRTSRRGYLYWLIALLITRESISRIFSEVLMRTVLEAVHLRNMVA
jgi:hypothetical protein